MARVNVYLPDELAERVRAAELNVSAVTRSALEAELAAGAASDWLRRVEALPASGLDHAQAIDALTAARAELGGDRDLA